MHFSSSVFFKKKSERKAPLTLFSLFVGVHTNCLVSCKNGLNSQFIAYSSATTSVAMCKQVLLLQAAVDTARKLRVQLLLLDSSRSSKQTFSNIKQRKRRRRSNF